MSSDRPLDPIRLEVLRHALQGVAEEMNVALMRTAYSTNITDRRDSSCAIYLGHGEPVAQSESGTPLHLGVMPAVVRSVLSRIPAGCMKPGDQYIMNIPYPEGPGHLNDLTLVCPVVYAGQVIALVANQAHHVDVGGMAPGSMPSSATEIFQEGLQLPPVKLIDEGRVVEDILAVFLANIRTPEISRGDLMAQAAANNVGAERVQELAASWGVETVQQAMAELLDHAERKMRALLSMLPNGDYRAEDFIDGPDGPLAIRALVTVADDELSADFTGTSEQVLAPLNCRPATVLACLAYVAQAMLDPGSTPNAGNLRPLRISAPEGSLLNARHPASVVHSNVITSQRICDVLMLALQAASPENVPAASSGTQSLVCIGGFDEARGEPFTYIETHGGGSGGQFGRDGQSAVHTHMTNTLNSPVEVIEQSFPFRILEYALAPDSAGFGRWRGGYGLRKSILVETPATATIAVDRVNSRPWGLEGGGEGTAARIELRRKHSMHPTSGRGTLRLEPGDVLTLVTPGGGGWGDPNQREQQPLLDDLDSELLTPAGAEAYGGPAR